MIKELIVNRIIIAKYRIDKTDLYIKIIDKDAKNMEALIILYIELLENIKFTYIGHLPLL